MCDCCHERPATRHYVLDDNMEATLCLGCVRKLRAEVSVVPINLAR